MRRRQLRAVATRVRDERGAVLIMVLAFTLIIIVVGLAFMEAGSSEARNAHERWASNNAFWLAEAGYQRFVGEEWSNAAWGRTNSPFADTLGNGSYWIVVRDTTISGVTNAVHINTNGAIPLPTGSTDAQRRIDLSAQVMAAAFDSDVVFSLGDVNVGSSGAFNDIDGKIHADGDITIPPGSTPPGNWSANEPIKPPALYTEIDSLGGANVSYYYVKVGGAPSADSVYILDRNQIWTTRRIPASLVSITGKGANAHATIGNLDGNHFDWNTGFFPIESGKQTVIVNFAELNAKPVDLVMDLSTGAQSIKSSVINTRYIGPNTYDARLDPTNWTGGTTQLRSGLQFEPVNGLALGVYDFEKVSGGTSTNVGTATWPAMTYVTHNFVKSTGNVNFNGMVLALGDVSFSGTTNMTFNAGFISNLPSSMNNVWQPGVTAAVNLLTWKEVARQ